MNKLVLDNCIVAISTGGSGERITEAEFNAILEKIRTKPKASRGQGYNLKADTLEWEPVELPEPIDTDDEATETDYIDALQDLGVEV